MSRGVTIAGVDPHPMGARYLSQVFNRGKKIVGVDIGPRLQIEPLRHLPRKILGSRGVERGRDGSLHQRYRTENRRARYREP